MIIPVDFALTLRPPKSSYDTGEIKINSIDVDKTTFPYAT